MLGTAGKYSHFRQQGFADRDSRVQRPTSFPTDSTLSNGLCPILLLYLGFLPWATREPCPLFTAAPVTCGAVGLSGAGTGPRPHLLFTADPGTCPWGRRLVLGGDTEHFRFPCKELPAVTSLEPGLVPKTFLRAC